MINTSSQNMFTFHFSSARLVKLAHLSTHSTSARQYPIQWQKEWKMTILEYNIYMLQLLCQTSSLPETTLEIEDWWLQSRPLISDLCFWSGCLLICHKCVSASVWYDLIRQQSPLFSSRPISWYGWKGSSVVIFRVLVAVSGIIAGMDSEPGERARWCKENS